MKPDPNAIFTARSSTPLQSTKISPPPVGSLRGRLWTMISNLLIQAEEEEAATSELESLKKLMDLKLFKLHEK
eukprot:CAMPEP_0170500330 /NCGR_PEP_ID=MMETSP0208-20121228/34459_1 /TAXON_ID=197538 /ORGANISM="Strombidium inclinatum, Strain S3" /LENGTH=72 /DNA_ID=CAMNT_0010778317 /DNA_START=729 /DNA_END=947 /DNA_ORIENTATION=+